MPEGDVVWRTARELHAALAGRVLTRSDFRVPRFATVDLAGRVVLETASRGKHLLTRVDGGVTIHTHLRMDGSWRIRPARGGDADPSRGGAARADPDPGPGHSYAHAYSRGRGASARYVSAVRDHRVRVVLENSQWQAVGYLLGVVEVLRTASEDRAVGHLGPDLLGPDWDSAEAVGRLRADPGRPIGEALLDQRNLAGIGNLYRAEVLFVRGVSPWRPVGEVPDLPDLVETARRMLEANKERATQVTTGNAARGQETWVYGRAGRPCRRCGTPVTVAGRPGLPGRPGPAREPGQPGRPGQPGPAREPGSSFGQETRSRNGPGTSPERVVFWCSSCQSGPDG